MKKKSVFLFFYLTLILCVANAENKATLTVNAGDYDRLDCVVSADVSDAKIDPFAKIELVETTAGKKTIVPCQLAQEGQKKLVLFWVLSGKTNAHASRHFVLEQNGKMVEGSVPRMGIDDTKQSLILKKDGKKVLQYNYTIVYPPAGEDIAYRRSGFIHPLWSPSGNVLTAIQPKDHFHHYGIWNPWTRVQYDGKMYDLWNLKDKTGTVRAKSVVKEYQGDVFAGFDAKLDHIIFNKKDEKVIMNEQWKVKVWNTEGGYLCDFVSCLHPSTPLPVLLKEYRYAGFVYRATEEWTRNNCEIVTSEGKIRKDIDGSRARWIYVTGQCGKDRSGVLFLGHPDNYNSPEPLRIWDENANGGRGDVFINFAPTKNKDWKLLPGKNYILRYRMMSYDGEMTKDRADALWNDFACPPKVKVTIVK